MKRLFLLLSFVAALALTAGCDKPEPQKFDNGITATFNVTLPGEEIATKAISDGTQATQLLFRVYGSDGRALSELDQIVTISGKKATVTAKLVRGVDYKIVFWAQKPGTYTIANGKVTIPNNTLSAMMNNDAYDAFYAIKEISAQDADFSTSVTLYRPFAQLNVGASAEDIATARASLVDVGSSLKTAFTIKGVKNTLDLLTGAVSGSVDVNYTAAVAPSDNITTKDNVTYRRIAMVYVLAAPQSATSSVTLNVNSKQNSSIDVAFAREVPNVPLRRNHRTNIVGEIFSLTGTFNVVVDERFDTPDTDVQIDVPAPTPLTYNVAIQDNIANGSVAVAGTSSAFEEGETVTLSVNPAENYELSYLAYTPANGGNAVEISLKTLQFPMPAFDVLVTARFAYVEPGPGPGGDEGSGTAADPFTVAGVRAYIDGLGEAGTISDDEVYVKGVIKSIPNNGQFNAQFGNASFYMTDPNGTDEFEAFRINYFNNQAWKEGDALVAVGDEVVVFGKVMLYTNSSSGAQTYETYQKKDVYNGYLISINGMDNVMPAPTITAKDASGNTTTVIPAGANEYLTVNIYASKSATIYYTTDGSTPTNASTQFTSDIRVTSACTIKAIAYGEGSLPSGVTSLAITKATEPTPGGGNGSGTADDPYTVAGVRAFIDGLGAAGTVSSEAVYVKGIVSRLDNNGQFNASFGNASFFMTDPNGTDEFEAFRVNYFGDVAWQEGNALVNVGDEAVICGKVKLYQPASGNPIYETNQVKDGDHGYLVSLNGKNSAMTAPTISAANASGAAATEIAAAAGSYLTVTITGNNVRYTTDGSDPTTSSPAYTAPFRVTEACTVKAFVPGDATNLPSSVVSLTITKATVTPADALVINVDKDAMNAVTDFPTAAGTTEGTYTIAGYSFTFKATTAFYWNKSSYFIMLGKADSYILTPAVSGKKLTKIQFKTGGGASENVIVDVYSADGSTSLGVNSAKLLKGTEYTWNVTGTAVNTSYQIRVTNAYNAQFQYLTLTYE